MRVMPCISGFLRQRAAHQLPTALPPALGQLHHLRRCINTSTLLVGQRLPGREHVDIRRGLLGFHLLRASSTDAADGLQPAATPESSAELLSQLELRLPSLCTGCGVRLQRTDPDAPGYFVVPKRLLEVALDKRVALESAQAELESAIQAAPAVLPPSEFDDQVEGVQAAAAGGAEGEPGGTSSSSSSPSQVLGTLELTGEGDDEEELPEVVCARCFSLRHSGKVKSEAAESALPEFDLGRKVGQKIYLQKDRRAVVLCVVDITDFDGSLPRMALKSLIPPPPAGSTTDTPPERLKFKLLVAINKFDLLPQKATPIRVEQWARLRLKQSGLPLPSSVYMVSAATGFGVKGMMEGLREALGLRSDLWVVGAQNAGKSSLIAAMKKASGTAGQRDPTIAPLPGTTLGLLRISGLPLGPKNRTYDTPGVPHPYQLTSLLEAEELRMVLPRRRLRPRTYRIGAGYSLLIGGVARLDLVETPSATIYLTVFVSSDITLHCGKTEGAEERRVRHGGDMLVPPGSEERVAELGPLVPRDVVVEGTAWDRSSQDVAIAGLGWIAVGLQGTALLRLWSYRPVGVTTRQALVPDYAQEFERPGYSTLLPKAKAGAGAGSKEGGAGSGKGKKTNARVVKAKKFQ